MRTRLVLTVLPLALLGTVALPSHAAPKQVKKSWTATAPVADLAGLCDGTIPSTHEEPFAVPAAGKLSVKLTGYPLDWDLFIRTPDGEEIASVVTFNEVESTIDVKFKKAQKVVIVGCNTAGGTTAEGSYLFTYK